MSTIKRFWKWFVTFLGRLFPPNNSGLLAELKARVEALEAKATPSDQGQADQGEVKVKP